MMSQCFGDMIDNGVVLFIDDLLVHGRGFDKVLLRLETSVFWIETKFSEMPIF